MTTDFAVIGTSASRIGLDAKLRGGAMYTADLHRPGMLYGRILRSPHPHARIVSIDASKALALPGVHDVMTYQDVPHVALDADVLPLDQTVRFVGDEVAVVSADSLSIAEDALALIEVEYELLPAVFDADEALAPGAPQLHPGVAGNVVGGADLVVERGDVDAALATAARRFEGRFRTGMHGPVGMETRAALAEWDGDNLTVWKTSRAVHAVDRRTIARVLGVPVENVRVVCTTMGGGFGNKDEGRLGVLTALAARRTGRPVHIEYSRNEEFVAGRNRQATEMSLTIGLDASNAPVAFDMTAVLNAGAYVASGMGVTRRIGQGPVYLYTSTSARFRGTTAYTNRPAGGSFRGLGAPLGHFALEVMIDQIAAELDIDPLDYRLAHHVTIEGQPGQRVTPADEIVNDQPVEGGVPFSSNGLHECLLAGAERIGWRERRQPNGSATGHLRRGMGMAMGVYKGGGGATSHAEVRLTPNGRVHLALGIVDVGQGSETVMAQIAAETLGVSLDRVEVTMGDTATTPPGHTTAGSTSTMTTGLAVKQACEQVRDQLLREANRGEPFDGDITNLLGDRSQDVVGEAEVTSGSKEAIINSFAAHFCEVEVDMQVGRIRVLRYVAAHDSGRIINPHMAENQVSGGVLQFLGIALREELLIDKRSGVTLNANFLEHKSTTIVDFPPIEVLFPAGPDPIGPYGAKALGEPPVVPVFACVANAVANATGTWLHEQPFTPSRVLQALKDQGRS